ncbi:MAG: hypothetical protein ACLTEE_02535 [Anaerobutyricum hallii]
MGGNLEVFSKLGEGSTFVITLPFERAQELKTTVIEKTEERIYSRYKNSSCRR